MTNTRNFGTRLGTLARVTINIHGKVASHASDSHMWSCRISGQIDAGARIPQKMVVGSRVRQHFN